LRESAGFDAFYLATSRRVLSHVYAVTGNLAESQDAVQEAYARAWQRWSTVSGYDDPESWVRLVAWRVAAGRWRATKRWIAVRARIGAPPPAAEPSPDAVAIAAALRRLPVGQRRVVVLYHLCDLPVARIAELTGTPVGTVKVWLARARNTLAELLVEEVEGVH
jgi:RNA polymerase sigma-70 factor, ECF subfamily